MNNDWKFLVSVYKETFPEKKEWEKFFDDHGDFNVNMFYYECDRSSTIEELYQAFKQRMLHETNTPIEGDGE